MTYPEQRVHEDPGGGSQYNPQLHPHGAAGSGKGGQFTSNGGSGSGKGHHKAPAHHKPAPLGPLKTTLAYNAGTNRGPGYGVPGGDGHVKALQNKLNSLGIKDSRGHGLAADGRLGPLTTSSIKAIQKRLGLKPDGRVTPDLYNKIMKLGKLPATAKPAAVKAPVKLPPTKRDWSGMDTRADIVSDSDGEVDAEMEARLVALLTGCSEQEMNEIADLGDMMNAEGGRV